ncbi:PREDICTED: histone-lysine N-methyltransferase ASHR3 isoform X2 [Nelumbo nucifera]|uniref:Histone-lysine N-methyltransferase ASHR3-like n=2 Tax=Nelumbo nucifera TaxID=4432 RepID=A0A822ZPS4_NELNU|nr:PREDICTED: histone-lysine N-methyltransferase ASHR3 isoform X2 [Nelumbo nucifera]DAD45475.1 TPA_asm: hypothetical protein HUJ06_003705 [Nelumbo nucifera]
MPNLDVFNSSSLALPHCPNLLSVSDFCDSSDSLYPSSVQSETLEKKNGWCCSWEQRRRYPNGSKEGIAGRNGLGIKFVRRDSKRLARGEMERTKKAVMGKSLEDHVKAWAEKKVASGVPEKECFLPFLVNATKMVECCLCCKVVYPGDELSCSVRGCQEVYHLKCAKERLGFSSSKSFKCPQHACFVCKQKGHWCCVRCTIASHTKCAPWPEDVICLTNQQRRAVCWRHSTNWKLEKKEIFSRLPLPYVEEEFKIDTIWKDLMENKMEPTPYVHIRRNVYLIKKKRDDADADMGCTNCSTMCSEDCVCRVQCISCSKSCHCSEACTNRPFRKEKKIKIVKTQYCGWGVVAAEFIKKGDFVIEYIGEVINDALCEQRLWDMKFRGDQNFYMCEIRKDFTIDATFKGNASRFLNHSCDPNCKLEKWQVDGETRVGVFAARSINVGEPLTYDYRFVHFGPKVECYCGAPNCQGFLGTKRKIEGFIETKRKIYKVDLCWGSKRRRSSMRYLAIMHQ